MQTQNYREQEQDTPPAVPVNRNTVWMVLLTALRIEDFFRQCVDMLDPTILNRPDELTYRYIWAAAVELYNEHRVLPTKDSLWAQTSSRIKSSDEATAATERWAYEIIQEAYNSQIHSTEAIASDLKAARGYLRALIQTRMLYDATSTFVDVVRQAGDVDPATVMAALTSKWQRVSMISERKSLDAIPNVWDRRGKTMTSSGIGWLDEFIGGGGVPGETNVLLGATGVAKTLLSVQMAVSYAISQREYERETGERGKAAIIIIYEDDGLSLQGRIMANAANIPVQTFRKVLTYDYLSRPGFLKDYEKQMQAAKPLDMQLCEMERLQQCLWLNQYLKPIDFGPSLSSEGGNRGLAEVREVCDRTVRELERPLGLIILDWCGLCLYNYLQTKYQNTDALTRELSTFVAAFTRDVVAPHGAVGWAVHQLSGQANDASPSRLPSHSDAQWCKTFAQLAWNCLVLGTKDQKRDICLLGATKSRNAAGKEKMICRVRGDFQRLEPADDEFRLDPHTGRFAEVTELDRLRDTMYDGQTTPPTNASDSDIAMETQ